jgi:hypothetical protein
MYLFLQGQMEIKRTGMNQGWRVLRRGGEIVFIKGNLGHPLTKRNAILRRNETITLAIEVPF